MQHCMNNGPVKLGSDSASYQNGKYIYMTGGVAGELATKTLASLECVKASQSK